jgi:hypothetical protein
MVNSVLPSVSPNKWDKPDATMVLHEELVSMPFEYDQFLQNTIPHRGNQPASFRELLF